MGHLKDFQTGAVSDPLTVGGVLTVTGGSAGAPAITTSGDTNTGIFFPAADTIAFSEGGVEAARFDSSGNLGIGTTSPNFGGFGSNTGGVQVNNATNASLKLSGNAGGDFYMVSGTSQHWLYATGAVPMSFATNGTERARIDSSGLLVGNTTAFSVNSSSATGLQLTSGGALVCYASSTVPAYIGRQTDDGILIDLRQAGTTEGNISVSGTTVSYNGGHLARYAQTIGAKDEAIVKGTVLTNLNEMNIYTDVEGNTVANEQLNKVKVSDVEGDANVAGVFVNWSHDEDHNVDEINMAMTGDMIIRIAQGTTVQRGDLLMSAGDGTAKPQGDDIIRSKTVAKVTSTHITCTYEDGSYCVPCVLMAC
jgi:hypothetical protein